MQCSFSVRCNLSYSCDPPGQVLTFLYIFLSPFVLYMMSLLQPAAYGSSGVGNQQAMRSACRCQWVSQLMVSESR